MGRKDFKQGVIIELEDKASGPAKNVETGFEALKGAIVKLGIIAGIGKLFSDFSAFMREATEAASAQQLITRKLEVALRGLGPAAATYVRSLEQQADALQKLGVASNEEIQSSQVLIANLGVQADQLEEATQAAVNLSAALGISLESAARNVGRTVGGFAGELGELVPELRALSTESLKAGEGIRVINEQFGGQAAAQAETYAASMTRLNEALADTSKVIGSGVTSDGAAASIRALAFAIEELNENAAREEATSFLGRMSEAWTDFKTTTVLATNALFGWGTIVGDVTPDIEELAQETEALAEAQRKESDSLKESIDIRDTATASTNAFLASVKDLGVTLGSEVNEAMEDNVALLIETDERLRSGLISRQDYDNITRAIAESERELQEEFRGASSELGALNQTFDAGEGSALRYSLALDQVGRSAIVAASATRVGSSGLTARSSGAQADVDLAFASGARPTSNGGRIKIRGGSRLLVT